VTMSRTKRDFRERVDRVDAGEMLLPNVWYRSPLSNYDHLLGEEREWANDDIAWCGFSLGDARDMEDTGDKASLGGLWVAERKGNKCSTCKRRQKEWDSAKTYTM
jgi:hypothetical protein